MAFDISSALGGAQAGLGIGGPFGSLVGGLFGGLFGGRKKKRARKQAKREARRRERQLLEASSPEFLLKTAGQLRPGIREALAPESQADVANIERIIGTSGLRETGAGALIRGAAAQIPGTRAVSESLRQAGDIQRLRLAALGGAPEDPGAFAELGQEPFAGAPEFGATIARRSLFSDIGQSLRRAAMPPEVEEDELTTSPFGRIRIG